MRTLSPEDWPRQQQFDHFQQVALPYVGVTAQVDVTEFLAYCQKHDLSFYRATLFAMAQVADELPWMRLRIRDGQVVCHDRVDTAVTALGDDNQVRFTKVPWQRDWPAFDVACAARSAEAAASDRLYNGNPDGDLDDDLVYHSCMPWLRFSQMIQPMPLDPVCSIPRVMWGKYGPEGDRITMPVALQAHHSLADGLHLAQYYRALEAKLSSPEALLA